MSLSAFIDNLLREVKVGRGIGLAVAVVFLAGCTYAGTWTRFRVPRTAMIEPRANVADFLDDTLRPLGFSRIPSPLPDRVVYASTEQGAQYVTVVLDAIGYSDSINSKVEVTIHVMDTSGADSEIAKRVREVIQGRFEVKYPVVLKFHTYRHSPFELGP